MRFENSAEYDAKINELVRENTQIISTCKEQVRFLNEEENELFDSRVKEINELKEEKNELLRSIEKLNLKNISIDKNMEKNEFSLQRAILSSLNAGENVVDLKRGYTVTGDSGEGEDVVGTDIWEVLRPLSDKNVLVKSGAQVRVGLSSDVQIPIYTAGNVSWEGEITEASDGGGSFDHITLSPKRLAAYFPISKRFLNQTSADVEAVIREGIANAVWAKIEDTLLGDAQGTANRPQGLLYGLTPVVVGGYAELTALEAGLQRDKFYDFSFIASPEAAADFRSMIKGQNGTGMVMEGEKMDGRDTEVTGRLASQTFLAGDFSQLIIGFWQNPEIKLIEDTYYAKRNQVCIVVNAEVDAKLARTDAVVLGTTDLD